MAVTSGRLREPPAPAYGHNRQQLLRLPDGAPTERTMREEEVTADRLAAYSDAVFAVIVTVMVLELRAPEEPTFSAAAIDVDQLRPSLHGIAPAFRDRVGRAYPARLTPGGVLRRRVRVHRRE